MEGFRAVFRTPERKTPTAKFGRDAVEKVREFHRGIPEYSVTPLAKLPELAGKLGVKGIYIKDESYRFGLNAFKVLGGSYAVAEAVKGRNGDVTFITATDGNHGRGVAWAAKRMGMKCVVYMPKGTAKERLDNILKLGADASITDLSYDDDVRMASADAERNGWVLVQDTSHDGYEEIPEKIMQGYTTMALEAAEQLGDVIPTHVFLQSGVGSMAGAVTAFLADFYGDGKPVITIVEPVTADCAFRTAEADDGKLHAVDGEMSTMMAGLACGEVCPIAWDYLRDYAECFVSMPDGAAAEAMRALAFPAGEDDAVVSGESGAAGFGAALAILTDPGLEDIKNRLGIDESSVILCISTEGATDRENYMRITGRTV